MAYSVRLLLCSDNKALFALHWSVLCSGLTPHSLFKTFPYLLVLQRSLHRTALPARRVHAARHPMGPRSNVEDSMDDAPPASSVHGGRRSALVLLPRVYPYGAGRLRRAGGAVVAGW